MHRRALVIPAALVLAVCATARAGEVDLPRFPAVSPDGSEITFSWRGDVWKVASEGGHAQRLTANDAEDSRSAWSPDGRWIAFNSDRSGHINVHLMAADGSDVRQITREEDACLLVGFAPDGRAVTVQSTLRDEAFSYPRPYTAPVEGGPLRPLHGAYGRWPQISPDSKVVAFTRGDSTWSRRNYRGSGNRDVWLYDPTTQAFTQLTSWHGNDGKAAWQDARTLVFLSDRELDTVNVWRMNVAEGESSARPLTSFEDVDVRDLDVSRDGRCAVFAVWDTLYRLDLRSPGAVPERIRITAPEDAGDDVEVRNVAREASEAQLGPDGKVMAVVAYGEIFVRPMEDGFPTQRVTENHVRERDIHWSPDGLKLYFVSESGGTNSIYAVRVARTRKDIKDEWEKATKPAEEKTEPEKTEPKPEPVEPEKKDDAEEPPAEPAPAAGEEEKKEETEKKPAAAKKKPKKPVPKEFDPARWEDAIAFTVEPVLVTADEDRAPRPSPDGKSLAFLRAQGDLMVLDLATGAVRTLVRGWDTGIDYRWSPDSRHVAYHQDDRDFNSDVFVVLADGSRAPVNVTRHPSNDVSPRWSADGKVLAFLSQRHNQEYDVWRVYLDRALEAMNEREIGEYYKEAAKEAKKRKPLPVEWKDEEEEKENAGKDDGKKDAAKEEKKKDEPKDLDLDDAYLRLARITSLDDNESNLEITPAGDRFVFTGKDGSTAALFSIGWDGKGLKNLGAVASVMHVSLDGDKLVYVAGMQAGVVNPSSGGPKTVGIAATLRIDRAQFAGAKFLEAARTLGLVFYHPTMKGLDWPAETARYLELARRARTPAEWDDVATMLLGELNASHLGVRSPRPGNPLAESSGRLGVDVAPVEGGFRVTGIVPYGPAVTGPMKILVGDVLTGVEGEPLAATDSLAARLAGRVNAETRLSIRRAREGADPLDLELLVTPISGGADRSLRYNAWQLENTRRVHEWSDGRIGYLHIRSMNESSLEEFERDLFAAADGRKGLLIDVRNNGGGYTADRILSSIMVRPHAYTVPRGADPSHKDGYPRDRLFIQRCTLPANMLCNEHSFSNAEIVSHAFKTLGRGTLVGEQTYGGVISTGGTALVDGTFLRLPFRGWYLPDGTDMELNGALPDLLVPMTPEAESRDDDPQLRAATEDLMRRL